MNTQDKLKTLEDKLKTLEDSVGDLSIKKCPQCQALRLMWFDRPFFNYMRLRYPVFICLTCNKSFEKKETLIEFKKEE